ncbi:hypothetical protein CTAYLR_008390 [Chrysophaeum taylorii]|uniref:isopentenyl-diphosphate Delta-isomerase n=1 Tax=Chrysophaeum taylorii TaxID=2483200 RepID=A0AAD7UJJ9_9STRA|nr:hypothetical protein CTAYLR_008390 [Chrysophaeum taylorii]
MATWSAEGASQDDLMLKDEVLLVNFKDEVIGHENKYNAHKFVVGQPKGLLHRAFSVLLFDGAGRLLLQQRASSKITFADVWTNTCCSHPLYGMAKSEVDDAGAVASGDPKGVKNAAVRKLDHELGIKTLEASQFTFVTRVHYWACDVGTHGPEAPWGEHEIDYVLVCKATEPLAIEPHPDEVRAYEWVTCDQLFAKFEEPGLKWSPWFKIIAHRFLKKWWSDVDALCAGEWFDASIHRFDCHTEGPVGSGGAMPFLDALAENGGEPGAAYREQLLADVATTTRAISGDAGAAAADAGKKQGGYGKVATHPSSSLLDLVLRPREVVAALWLKAVGFETNLASTDPDVAFCDEMLGKVSRSFAAVIRQLPAGVCLDICVFYLVLRALDTIEDDMEYSKDNPRAKEKRLREFFEVELRDPDCAVDGIGEGDERKLLQKFGAVVRVFRTLPESSRVVISDIARDMGAGMADTATAELAQGTKDVAEYNSYCHAVAGLVGEGLTRIFVARGFEADTLEASGELDWPFCENDNRLGLANSMGLFLQKTNIIRDYLEDYVDGRAFWPRSIWTKYANSDDLGEFSRPTARGGGESERIFKPALVDSCLAKGASSRSLACLDDLVADALDLVPDSLEYLRRCRTPQIYRFCSIPQVMAICTLAALFDDPRLFTGVVKIRKGLTARLILDTRRGHQATLAWFHRSVSAIAANIDASRATPDTKAKLRTTCARVLDLTADAAKKEDARLSITPRLFWLALVVAVVAAVARR